MKIGQVGKKYGISRDHLYYYINYGLLVPPKSGKQYIFDPPTLHDLDTILSLQQLGFTLAEIHHILSLYRITDGENDDIREELLQLYQHQKEKCQQELAKLHDQVEGLNQKIRELTARQKGPARKVGVPLSMLGLIACPRCHKTLALSQVAMDTRYIYQAQLACPCGYKAHIHDGILMTENRYTDNDDTPDVHRLMYKDLPAGMISLFQQACNFMNRQLDGMDLSGSVVLETYVNAWFFLYTQQSHFPENGQYIIVDKYPETLSMYKKLMEQEGHPLDVLYIADSTLQLPLVPGCVDLNIDFFAANEHNFYRPTFFYEELLPLLRKNARILGTYFYFDGGRKSMETLLATYPKASPHNFSLPWFRRSLEKWGFTLEQAENDGPSLDSGNNIGFGFHQKGEKLFLYPYAGRRV